MNKETKLSDSSQQVNANHIETSNFGPNGVINFFNYYSATPRPPGLAEMRVWIERARSDYQALIATHDIGRREKAAYARELDGFERGINGQGNVKDCKHYLRQLIASGIVSYLEKAGSLPPEPLPELIILDLAVFALWPVVTVPKLPKDWEDALATLTSPRMVTIVEAARSYLADNKVVDVALFATAIAEKSYTYGVLNLLEDLADPKRGGAALTAMAIATDVARPPRQTNAKMIVAWTLAASGWAGTLAVPELVEKIWDWVESEMSQGHAGSGGSLLEHVTQALLSHDNNSSSHSMPDPQVGGHGGHHGSWIDSIFDSH